MAQEADSRSCRTVRAQAVPGAAGSFYPASQRSPRSIRANVSGPGEEVEMEVAMNYRMLVVAMGGTLSA